MMRIPHLAKSFRTATAAVILVAVSAAVWAQSPQTVSRTAAAERTFNLLVLGDSIMWGQGLREEHKAWYHIKTWLEQDGKKVREYVEAHSGAVVGSVDDPPSAYQFPIDGEVAVGVPSINQELSRAVGAYADPAQVDLVLIDGCINDVNVLNLLNGGNSPDEISQLVTSKCGAPMEALLSRVARSFPSAHIIVTGYYPVISEKTPDSLLLRFVARTFYRPSTPQGPKLSGKQLRERLIELSRSWHQVSNGVLKTAVAKANDELGARRSRQRAVFVEIPFLPDYSFAARETRLWGFNAGFLRKLLAIISLGRIPLKTDDERLNQRVASCKEFYKRAASENSREKQTRELRRTLCRYASIGHPNRKGSLIYSEAIINQLKLVVGDVGWLRSPSLTTTPAAAGP